MIIFLLCLAAVKTTAIGVLSYLLVQQRRALADHKEAFRSTMNNVFEVQTSTLQVLTRHDSDLNSLATVVVGIPHVQQQLIAKADSFN